MRPRRWTGRGVVAGLFLAALVGLGLAEAARDVRAAPAFGAALRVCPEARPQGGRCGSVLVPLDRLAPSRGTVRVGFELYPAKGRGRQLGTVLVVPDGPGISSTAGFRDAAFGAFGGLRDRFALLLVDRRGTGKSQPVDCPRLQHGRGSFRAAVAACGAKLADASDRYGAADVAQDFEAVRAALGISKLDLYGTAYGAIEALAYAYRYPARIRSVVLASPVTPFRRDPWQGAQVRGFLRAASGFCARSHPCTTEIPHPARLIRRLVKRLRTHPVRGIAPDRRGGRTRVVVDEAALARIARFTAGDMVNQGELPAAARALLHDNDPAPLLRLGAESVAIPAEADRGPSDQSISMGALAAAFCTDAPVVWNRRAPRTTRVAQLRAAERALERGRFAPFSVAAWTADYRAAWDQPFDLTGAGTHYRSGPCLDWPAPHRVEPVIPPGKAFPRTPTLVLASSDSVHTPREPIRRLARRLRGSRLIEIHGMDHLPAIVEPCVQGILNRFYRSLAPGRARCAPDPGGPWYAPGRFPRTSAKATLARILRPGRDRSTRSDRRLATVVVQTVFDAYYHARSSMPVSRGLRGGRFRVDFKRNKPLAVFAFRSDRFASDVAVTGAITVKFANKQTWQGALRATGRALGGTTATLNVAGEFYPLSDRPVTVRGTVRGRRVALLVDMY